MKSLSYDTMMRTSRHQYILVRMVIQYEVNTRHINGTVVIFGSADLRTYLLVLRTACRQTHSKRTTQQQSGVLQPLRSPKAHNEMIYDHDDTRGSKVRTQECCELRYNMIRVLLQFITWDLYEYTTCENSNAWE